ncbi:MAG: hypothetical protein COB08_011655 [Rhodobacteraceae bacterium]|nr:hypothetical protein [Paracoccaceae bacterium]
MKHFTTDTKAPQPVTTWQNEKLGGAPLTGEKMFIENQKEIEELRDQQQSYLDSLPTETDEILGSALKLLQSNFGNFPEGFEFALHALDLLSDKLKNHDHDCENLEAAAYLAHSAFLGLRKSKEDLDHVSDILRNKFRLAKI